jgi:hypothetical protein
MDKLIASLENEKDLVPILWNSFQAEKFSDKL